MSRKLNQDQQAFTIIELLIATTVFSILLVGILASFVKISDLYYKGVTMSKTQENARSIVQSISDDIQFSTKAHNNFYADFKNTPQGVFCIGNHRYSYQIGNQVDSVYYGLARDTFGGGTCLAGALDPLTTVKMLDSGMQLNKLSVDCSNGRCNVKIHAIFYGGSPTDLFTSPCSTAPSPPPSCTTYTSSTYYQAPDALCTGSIQSTDLCATVDYDSTVLENRQ